MNYFEPPRRFGKSVRNAMILKLIIKPSGLPKGNLLWCNSKCMVKWNGTTGEVSTVEYENGSKIEMK